jgi:hypothetical protein
LRVIPIQFKTNLHSIDFNQLCCKLNVEHQHLKTK